MGALPSGFIEEHHDFNFLDDVQPVSINTL